MFSFHRRPRAAALLPLIPLATLLPTLPAQGQEEEKKDPDRGLPLEPARWARFTTSEGTWISLDVSPDGETIVFDLLGDLYRMPITGGEATRLTSGLPHDMQPRFSPDGSRIVFVSDRSGDENVWLIDAEGGEPTQLSKGVGSVFLSPEWMPDGKYVVVSRARAFFGLEKLWLYHVDGGTGIEMVGGGGGQRMLGATVDAEGRYIWYAERFGTWQYNAIFPQYQLWVYDRRTGTRTPMTSRYGSAFRPALSPDGERLAYASREDADTGIRLRDLDSGEERWLAYPVQRDDQESTASMDVHPGYAFTPDSEALVISYGGGIWRVPVDGGEPTAIPFTVNAEIAIGPEVEFEYPIEDTPTFIVKQIRNTRPSPDGSRIAFTALDRLYVAELPDGTPRRLTGDEVGEYHPVWSPDGGSVAYVTWDDDSGEGHIRRVSADGGASTNLTRTPAYYQQPAWSPDGGRIVAIRSSRRNVQEAVDPFIGLGLDSEFVWIPSEGGELTRIGPTGGRRQPHFTSDPDRIYYYGFARADAVPGTPNPPVAATALSSARWDDTDRRQHLAVTARANTDAGGVPSRFGRYVRSPESDLPMPPTFDDDGDELREQIVVRLGADAVVMAPQGDLALAHVGDDVYAVTVPDLGATLPRIEVAKPDSAAVPVWKLNELGVEFPAWGADGRTIHWSLGNALFTYDLDAAAGDTAYVPVERQIEVAAERDIPRGTVILRGGRAITMDGDEIIENADVVVTDNRIASVRAGPGEVPEGAQVIDVAGKTVLPGFVDTHAHMWNLWDFHWARPWIYQANLAYGVTTTRDPQTATTDVLSYEDMVRAGRMVGTARLSHGAGRLPVRLHPQLRARARGAAEVQPVLRHEDVQDVYVRESAAAAVAHHGGARTRPHADDGGRPRIPPQHDARDGRIPGDRALDADRAGVQRRRRAVRDIGDGQLSHPSRLLRGTVGRELLLHPRGHLRRREADALHAQAGTRRQGPAPGVVHGTGAGRLVRRGGVRLPETRRVDRGPRGGRGEDGRRQPRPAAGPRLPLGAVGDAERRHERARRPARGDAHGGGGDRARRRPRLDRSRQARGPRDPRRGPARGHPQLEHGPHGDDERATLRRRHARRAVAQTAAGPRRTVAEHRARGHDDLGHRQPGR